MSVRWVCPDCGKGQLAPSRLRKIDTRRFCLPCSKRTGLLVERSVPSLEKQREAAKAKRAERAKRQRAKAAEVKAAKRAKTEAAFMVDGMDLRVEAKRLWKIARRHYPNLPERCPEVRIGVGMGSYAHVGRGFITLSQHAGRCWSTLVHELAHMASPPKYVPGRQTLSAHHRDFYYAQKAIMETALPGFTVSFHEVGRWGYEVDDIIAGQLIAWLDGDTVAQRRARR